MTSQQPISVNVDIYGQQYKLRGHSNPEYMKMIAQSIDESMTKLAKNYPILDTHKLAVLTAVQVSEEVFRLRKENSRLELEEERLKLTVQQIDEMQQKLVDAQKLLDSYKHQAAITLDEVKLQYEQQFAKRDQQHTMVVSDLKADYEKKLSSFELSYHEEIETLKRQQEETVQLLQAQLTETTEIHKTELAKLAEDAEQDKKVALVQLKSKLETELAKQKVDYETLVKAYEDYRAKAEQQTLILQEQLETETTQLKLQYEEEATTLKQQYEQETSALKTQLHEESSAYLAQVSALELEVNVLKEQLTELNATNETERNSFEQRLMQADEQLIKALEIEIQLNDTIAQLEVTKNELEQNLCEKIAHLEGDLDTERENYTLVKTHLANVQTELDEVKAESEKRIAELYAQLSDTESYLTKSQEQTEQYKVKAAEQEQFISSLQKKLDDQEQLIKLADDTLIEQTLKAKEDLAQFEQTYRAIQVELEQQRAANIEFEQQQQQVIAQLKAQYDQLLKEKEASEQANKQMYDELFVEFEQMNKQKQETEQFHAKAFKELEQELEQQMEAKTDLITILQKQLEEATTEQQLTVLLVEELEEEVQRLKQKQVEFCDKERQYEHQLSEQNVHKQEIEKKATTLQTELQQLEEQLLKVEKEKEETEQSLNKVQAELNEKLNENHAVYELQAQLLVATKHIADVEAQRSALAEQHKAALAKSEELLQYLEMSAAKDRLAENQKLVLEEQIAALQAKVSEYEAEDADLHTALHKKEVEINSLTEQLNQYESQLAKLEVAAASSFEHNQQAEVVLQLEEQLEKIQAEHEKLQSEYVKLQTEYNEWIELLD